MSESIIIEARDVSCDWLAEALRPWLFEPSREWCVLWDAKAREPLPRLDTGHSIEAWEA